MEDSSSLEEGMEGMAEMFDISDLDNPEELIMSTTDEEDNINIKGIVKTEEPPPPQEREGEEVVSNVVIKIEKAEEDNKDDTRVQGTSPSIPPPVTPFENGVIIKSGPAPVLPEGPSEEGPAPPVLAEPVIISRNEGGITTTESESSESELESNMKTEEENQKEVPPVILPVINANDQKGEEDSHNSSPHPCPEMGQEQEQDPPPLGEQQQEGMQNQERSVEIQESIAEEDAVVGRDMNFPSTENNGSDSDLHLNQPIAVRNEENVDCNSEEIFNQRVENQELSIVDHQNQVQTEETDLPPKQQFYLPQKLLLKNEKEKIIQNEDKLVADTETERVDADENDLPPTRAFCLPEVLLIKKEKEDAHPPECPAESQPEDTEKHKDKQTNEECRTEKQRREAVEGLMRLWNIKEEKTEVVVEQDVSSNQSGVEENEIIRQEDQEQDQIQTSNLVSEEKDEDALPLAIPPPTELVQPKVEPEEEMDISEGQTSSISLSSAQEPETPTPDTEMPSENGVVEVKKERDSTVERQEEEGKEMCEVQPSPPTENLETGNGVEMKIQRDPTPPPPPKKGSRTGLKPGARRSQPVKVQKFITIRRFYCRICWAEVGSPYGLAKHLDKQHNIRVVKGSARILDADERDEKRDNERLSKLLHEVENKPREVDPFSSSSSSESEKENEDGGEGDNSENDGGPRRSRRSRTLTSAFPNKNEERSASPDSSSLLSSSEEEDGITGFEGPPPVVDQDEEYAKLRAKVTTKLQKNKDSYVRKANEDLRDRKISSSYSQCKDCFIELPTHPHFFAMQMDHKRLHDEGIYKKCQYCNMPFLYDHQLNVHLEGMNVPTVPEGMGSLEAEDLLYLTNQCRRGECRKIFTNRKCFLFHLTTHDRIHRCQICEKPFARYAVLLKHIEKNHNWEKRVFRCDFNGCDKMYDSYKGLRMHQVHLHERQAARANLDEENADKETTGGKVLTLWRQKVLEKQKRKKYKVMMMGSKGKFTTPRRSTSFQFQTPNSNNNGMDTTTARPRTPARTTQEDMDDDEVVHTLKRPAKQEFDHILSIAPRKGVVASDKKRNIPWVRTFTYTCICNRFFKTLTHRNFHLKQVHGIDATNPIPFKCQVPGCGKSTRNIAKYFEHMHYSHTEEIQEQVFAEALKEDFKHTGGKNELVGAGGEDEEEDEDLEITDDDDEEEEDEVHPKPAKRSRKNSYRLDSVAIKALNHFKTKDGWYCPECPMEQRKSFFQVWNVQRHLGRIHPNSDFVKRPDKIKHIEIVKSVANVRNVIVKIPALQLSLLKSNNQEKGDEEGGIVPVPSCAPTPAEALPGPSGVGIKLEHNQEDEQGRAGVEDDLLTMDSDPHALMLHRLFLTSKLGTGISKTRYVTCQCPICPIEEGKERRAWSSSKNFQNHLFRCHPECDLLRKSKLNLESVEPDVDMEPVPGPSALGIKIEQEQDPLDDDLLTKESDSYTLMLHRTFLTSKFAVARKANRHTTCVCPVCPVEEGKEKRVLSSDRNLQKHLFNCHPECDLLRKSKLNLKSIVDGRLLRYKQLKIQKGNMKKHKIVPQEEGDSLNKDSDPEDLVSESFQPPLDKRRKFWRNLRLGNGKPKKQKIVPQAEGDFLTKDSDPDLLSFHRTYLNSKYRVATTRSKNSICECPLCLVTETTGEGGGGKRLFSYIRGFQSHLFSVHPQCEILRISKLNLESIQRYKKPKGFNSTRNGNKSEEGGDSEDEEESVGGEGEDGELDMNMAAEPEGVSEEEESRTTSESSDFVPVPNKIKRRGRRRRPKQGAQRQLSLSSILRQAYKVDTGGYKCPVCDPTRIFTLAQNLAVHVKKAHPTSGFLMTVEKVLAGQNQGPVEREEEEESMDIPEAGGGAPPTPYDESEDSSHIETEHEEDEFIMEESSAKSRNFPAEPEEPLDSLKAKIRPLSSYGLDEYEHMTQYRFMIMAFSLNNDEHGRHYCPDCLEFGEGGGGRISHYSSGHNLLRHMKRHHTTSRLHKMKFSVPKVIKQKEGRVKRKRVPDREFGRRRKKRKVKGKKFKASDSTCAEYGDKGEDGDTQGQSQEGSVEQVPGPSTIEPQGEEQDKGNNSKEQEKEQGQSEVKVENENETVVQESEGEPQPPPPKKLKPWTLLCYLQYFSLPSNRAFCPACPYPWDGKGAYRKYPFSRDCLGVQRHWRFKHQDTIGKDKSPELQERLADWKCPHLGCEEKRHENVEELIRHLKTDHKGKVPEGQVEVNLEEVTPDSMSSSEEEVKEKDGTTTSSRSSRKTRRSSLPFHYKEPSDEEIDEEFHHHQTTVPLPRVQKRSSFITPEDEVGHFACPDCPKAFPSWEKLRAHSGWHTREVRMRRKMGGVTNMQGEEEDEDMEEVDPEEMMREMELEALKNSNNLPEVAVRLERLEVDEEHTNLPSASPKSAEGPDQQEKVGGVYRDIKLKDEPKEEDFSPSCPTLSPQDAPITHDPANSNEIEVTEHLDMKPELPPPPCEEVKKEML